MRKLLTIALLLLAAAPASAAWRTTATVSTWFTQLPTAKAAEFREALEWHFERDPAAALFFTSARGNITVTALDGTTSEVALTMSRSLAEAWINDYAPTICSDVGTLAARSACVDAAVRRSFAAIWNQYKASIQPPVTTETVP